MDQYNHIKHPLIKLVIKLLQILKLEDFQKQTILFKSHVNL